MTYAYTYSNKKLIVFDLDGTIAESKGKITPEIAEALTSLLEEKRVAVISGGHFKQFQEQFLNFLPSDTPLGNMTLLPTSGSSYYYYQNGEWEALYRHTFTDDEKTKIKKAFTEALAETGLSEEKNVYGERIEDRGSQITFSGLGGEAPLAEKKKWDPDHRKRARLVEALTPKLPDMTIRIGGTTSIDITKKGIDKGYAIEALERCTDIPVSEMLYVGDALYTGGNDESVIRTGIDTLEVTGPKETHDVINTVLSG